MTEFTESNDENNVPGPVPAGAECAGRSARVSKNERRHTVKGKKSRGGTRKSAIRKTKVRVTKPAGRSIPYGVSEAARILKGWGYIVGRVDDPGIPFDLIAHRGGETLFVTVVRPREPVMNASDVRHYYSRKVLELQPYWNSDADNIQFWLFSRPAGLLRYRVFRGGIWNVETMQNGWQEKRAGTADQETAEGNPPVQKSRAAPSPVHATGHS